MSPDELTKGHSMKSFPCFNDFLLYVLHQPKTIVFVLTDVIIVVLSFVAKIKIDKKFSKIKQTHPQTHIPYDDRQ